MRLALALALAVCACKRPDAKRQPNATDAGVDDRAIVPAGSLVAHAIEAWYAVLLPEPASAETLRALEAGARLRGFVIGEDVAKKWIVITATTPADAGYDGDPKKILTRIPDEDLPRLQATTGAISLGAGGKPADLEAIHAVLVTLARQAATEGHGWILDEQTFSVLDLATLDDGSPAAARDVPSHTAFYVDPEPGDGGLVAVELGGMSRYGLPDVRVPHVPDDLVDRLHDALDATAQTLLDRGGLTADGVLDVTAHAGTGQLRWRVTWGKTDDDDARVIDLEPTAPLGPALDAFYGDR
jgi:hypothetical protein